ncbi:branched-chain amino acid ABC transporter permease [Halomarina halobia]|uniref:Branched-chain amino acid ABC transporter permease n=1 Tax=Halomarina halobia TaxID=3033386 RepID=A0ABD6AEH2_9EURY|nr:branched-chain amino acid ABC transporter permease [Halomarina sp. PSR21]
MVLVESLVNGLIQGSIYAVFAASFTIIFGVMDIPNMGHAALFAGGAYVYFQVVQLSGLPLAVGILAAILAVALLGAIIERALLAPLYDRDESGYIFGVILVTLGVAQILERAFAQTWGHEPHYLAFGGLHNTPIAFLDTSVTVLELIVFLFALANFAFLYWLINSTTLGLSLRAIVQDRELARMKGVNVRRAFLSAFVLGSAMAAVAGVLNAAMFSLTPTMGFDLLIKAFIIVILGGIGRVFGAMLAGYALGLYEAFAVLTLSSYYIFASEFAVLILFFLVKAVVLRTGTESLTGALRQRVARVRGVR